VIEGHAEPPAGSEYLAHWNVVTPRYFSTLRIPLLKGRAFNEQDDENSPPVIIINNALAQSMFGGESPLGKRIRTWRSGGIPREIVGVVQDVRFYNVADAGRSLVFAPHRQDAYASMMMAVRTTGKPLALADAVRSAIGSLDSDLAIARLATMDRVTEAALSPTRLSTLLITVFAGVALVLALVGVYGVISESANQRTHEIGIRMALGAQRRDVLKLIVRQGLWLTLLGVTVGLIAAFALTRVMSGLLYEVSTTDLESFLGLSGGLIAVSLLASYLPARRAARLDPTVALRCE
jgi:putative ABC transport system permease protein